MEYLPKTINSQSQAVYCYNRFKKNTSHPKQDEVCLVGVRQITFIKKAYNSNFIQIHYTTVETVGNIEEENLVKNHSQRLQALELEAKVFKNAICRAPMFGLNLFFLIILIIFQEIHRLFSYEKLLYCVFRRLNMFLIVSCCLFLVPLIVSFK